MSRELVNASHAGDIGASLRALLILAKAANAEISDCPRIFTIRSSQRGRFDPRTAFTKPYLLDLWCEAPGAQHPVGDPYEFTAPKEWFVQVAQFLRVASKAVSLFVPMMGAVDSSISTDALKDSAQLMDSLAAAADRSAYDSQDGEDQAAELSPAQGAALRRFRELLLSIDPGRGFCGLERVLSSTGEWMWLCPSHYREIEPPLPSLSGSSIAVPLEESEKISDQGDDRDSASSLEN